MEADVTGAPDMERSVAVAVGDLGGLDIMVNNAGIWHGHRTILEETEAEFDSTMATNIKGVWLGCKAAISHMVRAGNGGSIVNIASVAGLVGLGAEPAYSASKGAVIGLNPPAGHRLCRAPDPGQRRGARLRRNLPVSVGHG